MFQSLAAAPTPNGRWLLLAINLSLMLACSNASTPPQQGNFDASPLQADALVPEQDGAPPPASCDDQNACTRDTVGPNNTCQHERLGSDTSCDDGDLCTFNDRCDGTGGCQGTPIACADDPGTCGARRSCDGTSQCVVTVPQSDTPCDDKSLCTTGDHCNGTGQCVGDAVPCESDACEHRICDPLVGCKVQLKAGTPIYETFEGGWTYSTQNSSGATIAFRVVDQDLPLYEMVAPGIQDKMLSITPDEATTCDWCGCSSACAYSFSGKTIYTAKTQKTGMVALKRYVKDATHRESVTPIAGWGEDKMDQGWVCPP